MENNIENPPEPKTNSDAVVALVLGIVSLSVPVAGLVLAIVSIVFASKSFKTIKMTSQDGKGMSIARIICSVITLLLHLFAIIAFIAFITVINVSA